MVFQIQTVFKRRTTVKKKRARIGSFLRPPLFFQFRDAFVEATGLRHESKIARSRVIKAGISPAIIKIPPPLVGPAFIISSQVHGSSDKKRSDVSSGCSVTVLVRLARSVAQHGKVTGRQSLLLSSERSPSHAHVHVSLGETFRRSPPTRLTSHVF